MPAALTGEGLFVSERAAPLTRELFDELTAGSAPFTLKVDYRGLPPPLEELDLVRLVPCSAHTAPRASLILRPSGDGFEFTRDNGGSPADRLARVIRVERPGATIDLDTHRWRTVGRLLARNATARAAFAAGGRAALLLGKLLHPFPCPVRLGAPDALSAGVRDKYAHPGDVANQERIATAGLEAWETSLLTGLLPPGGRARVLVVGAGAGRESLSLARLGIEVVGIDVVPALVAAAARRAAAEGLPARFLSTPVEALPRDAGFDIVLCSGGVYEHTPTRACRISLLRRLTDHLAPGGVVVLVAGWSPDRGPRYALVDGMRWLFGRVLGDRFTTEPGDRLVRHLSLASDHATACFFHVFQDPDAITREIEAGGLAWRRDPEGAWIVTRRPH